MARGIKADVVLELNTKEARFLSVLLRNTTKRGATLRGVTKALTDAGVPSALSDPAYKKTFDSFARRGVALNFVRRTLTPRMTPRRYSY